MEATITLNEALHRIRSGERFDIEFVTADKKRGTGGTLKVLTNCIISRLPGKAVANPESQEPRPEKGKAPRHFQNSTLNLQVLGTREIRKVHIRLITRFNGKTLL